MDRYLGVTDSVRTGFIIFLHLEVSFIFHFIQILAFLPFPKHSQPHSEPSQAFHRVHLFGAQSSSCLLDTNDLHGVSYMMINFHYVLPTK